jgi:polyhydroxyalkanoate synthesis regulator phasin
MIDLIKKSLFAGLGAAIVTKEKIEEATRKLVKEGKMTREDAEKLSQDLIESGRKQWDEAQAKVSDTIKKVIEGLDLVSKKDIEELNEKLKNFESRLHTVEQSDKSSLD